MALVCVLLVSCGGEARLVPLGQRSPTPHAAVPDATPVATPLATPVTPSIGAIVWVTMTDPVTNAPLDVVLSYAPEAPRITGATPVRALSAGSTIAATWAYNNTSLDAFSRQVVLSAAAGQTWISFHIERDAETVWPTGTYELAISLNGTIVQRAAVEVANQE